MRIRDLLAPESIQLNGSATGKEDVLNQMVSLMVKSGKIADEETYRKESLQERKRVPQELERALQFLIANQQP